MNNIRNVVFRSVLLLPLLLVILFQLMVVSGCSEEDKVTPPPPPQTIQIGVLLALDGNASRIGTHCNAGIEVALEDISDSLAAGDLDFEVHLEIENTSSDSDQALVGLENLTGGQINLVIGPTTDDEVSNTRDWADLNNLLLVSPSSMGTSLAQSDDNVYRLSPNDSQQARALAALLVYDGITIVIPFIRDDDWADNLLTSTGIEYLSRGGEMMDGIRYDTETQNFTEYLDSLKTLIMNENDTTLAVCVFAKDEIENIFISAEDHYVVELANWYGSAASVRTSELTASPNLGEIAADWVGGFPCPVFREDESEVRHKIEVKLGEEPLSYALVAYDALWIATLTYTGLGVTNPPFDDLEEAFIQTANSHNGITGLTELDEAGDRLFGDFDFWKIRRVVIDPNEFEWYKYARYLSETDEITENIGD